MLNYIIQNILFMKISVYIIILFSFSLSSSIFISKSIDTSVIYDDTELENIKLIENTYSIGYNLEVWKKKKVKYGVELGFDIIGNENVKFLSIHTIGKYELSKKVFIWGLLGIDFFDHDFIYNNIQEYLPDKKGGETFGIGITYLINKKIPLSIKYQIINFSEVNEDQWRDARIARTSIQLGYNFKD